VHLLPQLRELETRYRYDLVVIGVHTAKFPAERDDRHLAAAVERLEIEHPVVNDVEFSIWHAYAVRAWPTLMFIDPTGQVIARHEGELGGTDLTELLDALLIEFRDAGKLRSGPLPGLSLFDVKKPTGELAFPGGIVVDGSTNRLYIANTNNHLILDTTLDGVVRRSVGSGRAGFSDGHFQTAEFCFPQGIALYGDSLYVADTGNHAIRHIDLPSGQVTTIVGTGHLSPIYASGGERLSTVLRSPWNIAIVDDTLWISMAGSHQLWMHRIGTDEIRRAVGSGHEGLRDGVTAAAWLAQPSGITAFNEGHSLLFTDSETSAVRIADLPGRGDGTVRTLIGDGLFEFGDIDGPASIARLQHPLGVAVHDSSSTIYVADTYNNKIKRLNPYTNSVTAWLGDGSPGYQDGVGVGAQLFEPSGLGISGNMLYIADTNNHAIRCANLATGEVTTIDIRR